MGAGVVGRAIERPPGGAEGVLVARLCLGSDVGGVILLVRHGGDATGGAGRGIRGIATNAAEDDGGFRIQRWDHGDL